MLFLAIREANQRREAMQHFATELHRSMAYHPLNPLNPLNSLNPLKASKKLS